MQKERDIFSAPFKVGDVVTIRCLVTAISPVRADSPATLGVDWGGSGDRVTCAVEVNGNIGEATGVTFQVSPVQCRRTGSALQQ